MWITGSVPIWIWDSCNIIYNQVNHNVFLFEICLVLNAPYLVTHRKVSMKNLGGTLFGANNQFGSLWNQLKPWGVSVQQAEGAPARVAECGRDGHHRLAHTHIGSLDIQLPHWLAANIDDPLARLAKCWKWQDAFTSGQVIATKSRPQGEKLDVVSKNKFCGNSVYWQSTLTRSRGKKRNKITSGRLLSW